MYDAAELIEQIRTDALRIGNFTLASGKQAKYYLDCRKVVLDARGASLIAAGMLDMLADDMPELVGGLAIGADPITGAILTLAGIQGVDLRGVMVRKEPKGHGTNQYVEGPFVEGDRVVVIEDVVTTGSSALMAARRCKDVGLEVVGGLAIIDRLEGGQEAFAEAGYPLRTLFTVNDLGLQEAASR